jgi:hypothetical protein
MVAHDLAIPYWLAEAAVAWVFQDVPGVSWDLPGHPKV